MAKRKKTQKTRAFQPPTTVLVTGYMYGGAPLVHVIRPDAVSPSFNGKVWQYKLDGPVVTKVVIEKA